MTKFFKNIFKLILIGTPFFIIVLFSKNFIPNYKTKSKNKKIENYIYINFSTHNDKFKWFCNNLFFLKNKLLNKFNFVKILEIGSFEGRSAIFFTNEYKNSSITCVDTWKGSDEHNDFDFSIIEKNFDINTAQIKYANRLKKYKKNSDIFFSENKGDFDIIYVDGDHSHIQLKKDIENSWCILKNGGILILDDYVWWYYKKLTENPASVINNFILKKINEISDLIVWKQVIIKKK